MIALCYMSIGGTAAAAAAKESIRHSNEFQVLLFAINDLQDDLPG